MTAAFGSFTGASAAVPMTEALWVSDPLGWNYSRVRTNPELIVDHRSRAGFEVYGPEGTGDWLSGRRIPYVVQETPNFEKAGADYPGFADVEAKLKDLARRFPERARLLSIGKSVRGRDLYLLKISRDPAVDARRPEFKYVANMHGDEIAGRELVTRFAEELLESYGRDPELTELVDRTEIYLMPTLNPDGAEQRRRGNANSVDLNRDFPDFLSDRRNTPVGRQPETAAMMNFQVQRNFALSANFHGGSEVVNYPWDTTAADHPFVNLIRELSLSYSRGVPYMFQSREFPSGIVNGHKWYEIDGGMQDWSESFYQDLQVTIELTSAKWPAYAQIPHYYRENRKGLVEYLKRVHQGAGFYFDDGRADARGLTGKVRLERSGKEIGAYDFRNGEFYRVLEPGDYEFSVELANGERHRFSRTVEAGVIAATGNYEVLR